ncbi:MAG: hypothetical protein IPM69_19140 [Ignavibacteria bacterium]|nr:hypothetical protein [Ignavibacteria bacterium]
MKPTASPQFSLSRWTRATFWGWLLGVVFILMLSSFLDSIGIENMQFYLGIGMGAGVGFTQWLTLRRWIRVRLHWIWYSIIGMGIPFIIMDLLVPKSVSYKIQFSMAFGALTVGWLQSNLLNAQKKHASVWMVGSLLGWTAAALTVQAIDYTMKLKPTITSNLLLAAINLSLILAGGIVLGLITGKALKKIIVKDE